MSEIKDSLGLENVGIIRRNLDVDSLMKDAVEKEGAKIALVGVENWGHNFKKAGDLNKAGGTLKKEDFKILMSHDP